MRKAVPSSKRTAAAASSAQPLQSSVQLKSVSGDYNALHDKLAERIYSRRSSTEMQNAEGILPKRGSGELLSRSGPVQLKVRSTSLVNEQVGIVQRVETDRAAPGDARALRRSTDITDRHSIPRPEPPAPGALRDYSGMSNLASWAATLMRTRIPDLFRTQPGLPGHAQQIQQELSILNNIVNNFDRPAGDESGPRYIELAMQFVGQIKKELIKFANQASRLNEFPFSVLFKFPYKSKLSLKNTGDGRLRVNGRPYMR